MIPARTIHPFPARMAPELALRSLQSLPRNSVVLDPMSGSGLVLRQATALGHRAIGFDLDPLAVLMSRVWTTPIDISTIEDELEAVLDDAGSVDLRHVHLPWIHGDGPTAAFVSYWFAEEQRRDLMRLSTAITRRSLEGSSPRRRIALDVLRIALSRIIITKEPKASLARDTSHSRPHRVSMESTFDVLAGFEQSVEEVVARLEDSPPARVAEISRGDARRLRLPSESVDAVLTSPPYLNAIDYMRGHRMSLVWLGYSITELRSIRSASIGAERASDPSKPRPELKTLVSAMCGESSMNNRFEAMVTRYALDLLRFMAQIARVLKPGGSATLVVGNSCVNGTFVRNSDGIVEAGRLAGLKCVSRKERELPSANRYLPMTEKGSLSKRMRTEIVLSFKKPS